MDSMEVDLELKEAHLTRNSVQSIITLSITAFDGVLVAATPFCNNAADSGNDVGGASEEQEEAGDRSMGYQPEFSGFHLRSNSKSKKKF